MPCSFFGHAPPTTQIWFAPPGSGGHVCVVGAPGKYLAQSHPPVAQPSAGAYFVQAPAMQTSSTAQATKVVQLVPQCVGSSARSQQLLEQLVRPGGQPPPPEHEPLLQL